MNAEKKKNLAYYSKIIWLYTKYQLITKGILALIIFPLFTLSIQYLIKSSGRTNLSSGDYIQFLFSFKGVEMLALVLVLLIILVGLDINAFIIMSAMIKENRMITNIRSIIHIGIRSIKSFLKPSGLFLLLYIALIVPLVSIGITISPMENFQIPNFIKTVIMDNSLLKILFFAIIFILSIITLVFIFVFHYILITGYDIKKALRESLNLMRKYWKEFIIDILKKGFIRLSIITIIILGLIFIMVLPAYLIPKTIAISRFLTLFTMFIILGIIAFIAFMAVPVAVGELTGLFYEFNEKEGKEIKLFMNFDDEKIDFKEPLENRLGSRKLLKIILGIILLGDMILAIVFTINFEEIFNPKRNIELIAHRAGGDLAAENSIKGLEEAIKEDAKWSEIDVQRTKDGKYIINHDPNFKRVAGSLKSSMDMNFEEIKNLEVKDSFDSSRPSQEVASLEEFLDSAKGRIGLFIELKGSTANEKMVDDIVKSVKDRDMENDIALISLDYELIKYLEREYPEIKSGFIYFFSIGNIGNLEGDYLIMEEREASKGRIKEIQAAGKKAIVWTVNTPESIEKFIKSNVDGIITDRIKDIKIAIEESKDRTDIELIMDKFLEFDK